MITNEQKLALEARIKELYQAVCDLGESWAKQHVQLIEATAKCAETKAERDALAIQNQQMRESLTLWKIASDNSEECEFDDMAAYSIPMPLFCDADEATEAAIAIPDTSEIIKRHDAEVLRKAAEHLHAKARAYLNEFDRSI